MRINRVCELSGGHDKAIRFVSWSDDGSMLITTAERQVCVWDVSKAVTKQTLTGHQSDVVDAACNSDQMLVTAGRDPALILWDIPTGAIRLQSGGFSPYSSVAWIDHQTVISGNEAGVLSSRTILNWDRPKNTTAHQGQITELQVVTNKNTRLCISSATDNCLKVWDLASMKPVRLFEPQFSSQRFALARNGSQIVMFGDDSKLQIHSFPEFQPVGELKTGFTHIPSIAVSDTSRWLVAMGPEAKSEIWDLESFKLFDTINSTSIRAASRGVAFQPHSERLAIRGCSKRSVSIYDLAKLETRLTNDVPLSVGAGQRFAVALSFSSNQRAVVQAVAENLSESMGRDSIFYDAYHQAELARPNLDTYLQDLYRNQSELLVVFIGGDYTSSEWCQIESRAIRDLIKQGQGDRIMFVKVDDQPVGGVFQIDGFVDARYLSPQHIAGEIRRRLQVERQNRSDV